MWAGARVCQSLCKETQRGMDDDGRRYTAVPRTWRVINMRQNNRVMPGREPSLAETAKRQRERVGAAGLAERRALRCGGIRIVE